MKSQFLGNKESWLKKEYKLRPLKFVAFVLAVFFFTTLAFLFINVMNVHNQTQLRGGDVPFFEGSN